MWHFPSGAEAFRASVYEGKQSFSDGFCRNDKPPISWKNLPLFETVGVICAYRPAHWDGSMPGRLQGSITLGFAAIKSDQTGFRRDHSADARRPRVGPELPLGPS